MVSGYHHSHRACLPGVLALTYRLTDDTWGPSGLSPSGWTLCLALWLVGKHDRNKREGQAKGRQARGPILLSRQTVRQARGPLSCHGHVCYLFNSSPPSCIIVGLITAAKGGSDQTGPSHGAMAAMSVNMIASYRVILYEYHGD